MEAVATISPLSAQDNEVLMYYLLRFEFETTSDWSTTDRTDRGPTRSPPRQETEEELPEDCPPLTVMGDFAKTLSA